MNHHEKINYIEFAASNLPATKAFFETAFKWSFTDYGPDYVAFSNDAMDGGFYKADLTSSTSNGAALIIFYSNKPEATLAKIEKSGGKIIKPTYAFPDGRRFHFTEPSGNEFAVWSDV